MFDEEQTNMNVVTPHGFKKGTIRGDPGAVS